MQDHACRGSPCCPSSRRPPGPGYKARICPTPVLRSWDHALSKNICLPSWHLKLLISSKIQECHISDKGQHSVVLHPFLTCTWCPTPSAAARWAEPRGCRPRRGAASSGTSSRTASSSVGGSERWGRGRWRRGRGGGRRPGRRPPRGRGWRRGRRYWAAHRGAGMRLEFIH